MSDASLAFSPADQSLLERYQCGVQVVDDALAGITEEEWDRRTNGEWSARMVVHHLADAETNSYLRLRRLVAEESPVIQAYDEGLWAATPQLGYETFDVETSLDVFRAVRAGTVAVLTRLTPADLDRAGTHTESGPYAVRDWLRIYAEHAEEHADQIRRARRGESEQHAGGAS